MKSRWLVVLLLVVAFGAGAWMLLRPPDLRLPPAAAAMPEAPAPRALPPAPGKLAASAVLSIDPRAGRVKQSAQVGRASLYVEFLNARQLKPLYDRLKASPEGQTPEGQYLLYEMLRRCATVTDRTTPRPFMRQTPKRDEFVASLQPNDPQRDKRIAAFDEVETNRCAGFEGASITQAELNKLLAEAVNGGDAKARALAIEQELFQNRRAAGRMDNVTLSDAQVETLRQVLTSRDPGAIVTAGRLLSNTWHDFSLRIGTDGELAEPRALYNAWQMLACDYGYPCDANNERVLRECALQGHCQATSLQDHLLFYGSSPHDSQLVAQYQQILRNAVETGDWSQVAVVRAPRPPGSPRMFWFGTPGR